MRVLLSGYYGYGNLGDEAILAAISAGLRERGHDVTVLSADPAATHAAHGVAARGRLGALPFALAAADALVSGGGGLLQDATSRRSLLYYLGVIRAARAVGLRTVAYGQSIGPLSERGQRAVARALAGCPVAVRDAPSQALLAEAGTPSTLVADAALALPRPAAAGGDGLLMIPRADVTGAREALTALARVALADGVAATVAALQPGPDADDAQAIAHAVPGVHVRTLATVDEALSAAAAADAVASVRLHGLIFAARAGTPHIGVRYDPKVSGFLQASGGTSVEVPVAPDALVAAWRAGALGGPRDAAAGDALAADARAGLDWLDRALRASRDGPAPG